MDDRDDLSTRRFRSELFFAVEEKLRENQIEIPFPQRDLHLKSGNFVLQAPPEVGEAKSGADEPPPRRCRSGPSPPLEERLGEEAA